MMILSQQAEEAAALAAAQAMCAAARTAPKTKGQDFLETCIATGEEKEKLARKMDELAEKTGMAFLHRDAENLRKSAAVVLLGHHNAVRGLNEGCQFCGFENCRACTENGGSCAFTGIDLGIALGSAVSVAADWRVDNRIMFSVGKAALELGFFEKDVCQAFGIPVSVTGKSPYFDRK